MLLAVDTSTAWIGLALFDGTRILAEMNFQSKTHHTVELSPAVREILERCAVKPGSLQALGVALGPGSFTSLRIGLAMVKGIALALRIPVVGVPTMDVIAAAQPVRETQLAAVLHSGRGRLAVQWFDARAGAWVKRGEPEVTTAEELVLQFNKPTQVAGELDADERQVLSRRRRNAIVASPALALRRPSFLAEIAWERWQKGDTDEIVSLSPIYLHMNEPISAA